MKRNNNRYLTVITAGILLIIAGCEKNDLRLTVYDLPTDKAYVRFVFLSPGSPPVMIKVNDVKINGSNTPGSNGVFPSIINVPDYAAVPGNGIMKLSLPNLGTANDSVLIFTGNLGIEAAKFYSVILADTGVDRTLFSIEDKLGPVQDSGFFNIRLINAMAKSPAVSLIRVDSASPSVVTRDTIIRDLAYKSGSTFIKVPILGVNANVRFRLFNNTNGNIGPVVASPAASGNQSVNRRSVTLYAGGFANGTGANASTLSNAIYNK
jgi:hypothetical protein